MGGMTAKAGGEGAVPLVPTRGDRLAQRLLAGPVTAFIGAVCLFQLVTWIPHYLTWPLWADHDAYATLAHGWESGLLPYRDLYCNQLPGPIYLFWILGRLAGWEGSAAIYVFDACTVVGLGLVLLAWSRRLFGTSLPGAVGYLCFLSYYLGLDYSLAAQRDWHAPFFAILGILILQTWRGRIAAPAISAVALAFAVLLRPHAVLFLPAVALQLLGEVRAGSGLRRPAVWVSSFLIAVALSFIPLAMSGLLPDFVAGLVNNNSTSERGAARIVMILSGLLGQFDTFAYIVVPLAVFLIPKSDRKQGLAAAVWLAAFLLVLWYKPIHPRNHTYLKIPLAVVFAVNAGVLAHLLVSAGRIPASFRFLMVSLLLAISCKVRPEFCAFRPSVWAAADAIRGQARGNTPPGYKRGPVLTSAFYPWADYRALLDYLEHSTPPRTKIANALKGDPAVVGLLGRMPAFPTESISWLQLANPRDEVRFAEALEHEPDSVVIWSPGETGPDAAFKMDRLEAAIRRMYEPGARFGAIEVWRRKGAGGAEGVAAN